MKKFTMLSIIIAAFLLILGLILTGIGIASDGDIRSMWKNEEFALINGSFDMDFDDDFDMEFDMEDFTEVFQCNSEELRNLNIDISAGSLVIKPSKNDTCKIITSNTSYIRCDLDDGTLNVEETSNRRRRFNLFYIGWLENGYNKTILYLPEKEFESIKIAIEAGCLKLYKCEAETFGLDVKAGAFYGVDVQKFGEFTANVEAGYIEIEELYATQGTVSCTTGNFNLLGGVLQSADVECQLGAVDISLFGKEEDYGFDLSVGLGSIDVGSNSYSGIESTHQKEGRYNVTIRCELGSVTVDFENSL